MSSCTAPWCAERRGVHIHQCVALCFQPYPPFAAQMEGFIMTLDSCSLPPQIWPWLKRIFLRLRVLKHVEQTLIGGLGFHRPPKSLKHVQTLLSKNLKNWGYERVNHYDRGWVRFSQSIARTTRKRPSGRTLAATPIKSTRSKPLKSL